MRVVLHAVVSLSLGVGQEAHRCADAEHCGEHNEPERGPFIRQHRLHAALDRRLAEGKRAGADAVVRAAQVQQRLRVVRAPGDGQAAYHTLVAGELYVAAKERVGQPDQRIIPVHGQNEPAEGLYHVVASRDMRPLVSEHLLPRALVQAEGQVDARPYEPQHEGRGDALALEHVALEPHGLGHAAAEAEPAHQRPEQHHRRARKPYHRRDGQQHLQRVCTRGRLGRKGGGERGIYRVVEGRDAGVQLRRGGVHHALGQRLGAGDEAQGALYANGQHEAQSHHGPEQQPEALGRPFEQNAEHDDGQDEPRRGDAHVQRLDEHVSHLPRPPCIRLSCAASHRARRPRAAGAL